MDEGYRNDFERNAGAAAPFVARANFRYAHAWLDAAGVEVTGYPLEECLAEIARFV